MAIPSEEAARRSARPHGLLTPHQLNAFSLRLQAVRTPEAREPLVVREASQLPTGEGDAAVVQALTDTEARHAK